MIDLDIPDDELSDAEIDASFDVHKKRGPKPKSHCENGHEFTPENTKTIGNRRFCRACCNQRNREYKARKRAAAAIGESDE